MTIAPASFGVFGGALLVGNFGEGNPSIHAFNPTTGAFLGTLNDESGNGIVIDELWALAFGNGGSGGDSNTLYFTAGTADEEHGLFGKLNPTTATATSLIQFSSDTFTIGESGGHIDITVTRSGDVSGSASVNFNTYDSSQAGHASQKSDYEIALGTINFAPGETSKTVRILIVNDNFVEGNETINLALSNPIGAGVGLGTPNTATLTITDNDAAAGLNPIDITSFFVRQHYLDFLNREPDTTGLNAWISTINNCAAGSTTCDRVAVSSNFFFSDEYQARGYFASRFYFAAFARNPVYREFVGDLGRLNGATAAQSAALKTTFASDFTQRSEFHTTFDALTNAQYVDRLITNTGVTFSTAQRDQFVADLNSSTKTRAQVLRDIVDASQFSGNQATFNRAFVLAEYFGYLRRDPDTSGFNAWLAFLNANPGSFRTMVNGFVNSLEYRLRFGAS
ncbi:MAG: hypothetical protein QOE33_813 [Acidobacteriota bacterium]|nr:hypothetical protein [Acidobacteriota bacterium]